VSLTGDPLRDYFATYTVQANLLRRTAADHPVEQLAAFAAASARHGVAFATAIRVDGTELPVGHDARWWIEQLERGDPAERMFGGLALATADPDFPVNAAYARELLPPGDRTLDRVRVEFPVAPAAPARDAAALADWLAAVAPAFGAEVAWIHTSDLLGLVRTAREPGGMEPGWWANLPADTLETFAALPGTPDALSVPEAVWWINAWPRRVLDRVGPRVDAVAWSRAAPLPDGGRLLIATEAPPDAAHPDALARIAAITRDIDLAALQQRAA
jgi:hypothetical protein